MIDLSELSRFGQDIQGDSVTAYPLIIVGADTDNPIYISTIKETIKSNDVPLHFSDYNLKISNIKESIDLRNHKFKISNVSITLNNYENGSQRLSDSLTNFINTKVDVYYKTQSCKTIEDCLPLYTGIVRRYEHDSSTVKITLEDLTDSSFHKDVPIANLGTRKECYSKEYFNKYIPMVYGSVSRAPAIPFLDSVGNMGEYYISIIADDVEDVTLSGRQLNIKDFGTSEEHPEDRILPTNRTNGVEGNHPFYIYKDDYFKVLQDYEKDFHVTSIENEFYENIYNDSEQYRIDDSRNFLTIKKKYASGYFQNPPANNELQAFKVHHPSQVEVVDTDLEVSPDGVQGAASSKIINLGLVDNATIYRPEASFDTADKPSLFFDDDLSGEFATYSEIPYNQINITEEDLETESLFEVTDFTPYTDSSNYLGIYHPMDNTSLRHTNYLHTISSWLNINSHLFNEVAGQETVKYVKLPHTSSIKYKLHDHIMNPENGWISEPPIGSATWGMNLFTYGTMRVLPQYRIDSGHTASWCAASGLQGNETEDMTMVTKSITTANTNSLESVPYNVNQYTGDHYYVFSTCESGNLFISGSFTVGSFISSYDRIICSPYHTWLAYDYQTGPGYSWDFVPLTTVDRTYKLTYANDTCTIVDNFITDTQNHPQVTHHYFPRAVKSQTDNEYYNLEAIRKDYHMQGSYSYGSGNHQPVRSVDGGYFHKTVTNRDILTGKKGTSPTYSPTTVLKIPANPETMEIIGLGYNYFIIGNWIPETMGAYSDNKVSTDENGETSLFINLWNNGIEGISYLFDSIDEFPVYTPKTLISKQYGDSDQLTVACKFDCDWNGTDTYTHHFGTGTDSWTSEEKFAGGYGNNDTDSSNNRKITERQVWGRDGDMGEGSSWFIYNKDTISADQTLHRLPNDSSDIGITNSSVSPSSTDIGISKGTIIAGGTLTPMSHKSVSQNNNEWANVCSNIDTGNIRVFGQNKNSITLEAGDISNAERRLNLLFPFSNIKSDDTMPSETNMFMYGKIKLFIDANQLEGGAISHSMSSTSRLLVQAYPASGEAESNIDFNLADLGDGINLIDISGSETNYFTGSEIQEVLWESKSESPQEGVDNSNNQYSLITDSYMPIWENLNDYNALSLIFRVTGDYGDKAQISTNIHSIGVVQFSIFEKSLDDKLFVDVLGRVNNASDSLGEFLKYTGTETEEGSVLIEKPTDVIYHFLEKEIGQVDVIDFNNTSEARNNSIINKLAFSISDKINSKKLIEDICNSTNLYPKYNNDGTFSFKYLKNQYQTTDVNFTIKDKDIISFSFNRTPIEDVITMVNVKYRKDYALDEYTRETGYCDAHDFYGNGDHGADILHFTYNRLTNPTAKIKGYDYNSFGLTRESNILEYETDYIRNHQDAVKLRDFLLKQNCNQHNIIKCTLPLKYINMEVGDIIKFDELHNNTKAYGEDYTVSIFRNNQTILPYFIVDSIAKSSKNIKITCTQTHNLHANFTAGLGSLSRRSPIGIYGVEIVETESEDNVLGYNVMGTFDAGGHFTFADVGYFEQIVANNVNYMTSMQKRNANLNADDSIDQYDLNAIIALFSLVGADEESVDDDSTDTTTDGFNGILGDINQDGIVNVTDIIAMVSYILGNSGEWSEDQVEYIAANMNEDELINVIDIIATVSEILG